VLAAGEATADLEAVVVMEETEPTKRIRSRRRPNGGSPQRCRIFLDPEETGRTVATVALVAGEPEAFLMASTAHRVGRALKVRPRL
jgi:hypothetical protein